MKCPECKKEITIRAAAMIPKEQKFTVKLTLNGGFIGAQTFGDTVTNMSKTLKLVAEGLHETVEVFLSDIRFVKNEIEADFVVVKVQEEPK